MEDNLKRLVGLAERQIKIESEVSCAEEDLKNKKESLKRLREHEIPELMAEIGISEIKLESGQKLSLKESIKARILNEGFFEWLDHEGYADIIDNEVKVNFKHGQDDVATSCVNQLRKQGFSVNNKKSVHHARLNAFCGEQISKGVYPPEESLDIFVLKQSKIGK